MLVRGGDLDPDILCEDALRYHSIYGVYGVSVFAVRDATIDELAQHAPLVRFDRLSPLACRPGDPIANERRAAGSIRLDDYI